MELVHLHITIKKRIMIDCAQKLLIVSKLFMVLCFSVVFFGSLFIRNMQKKKNQYTLK